jgi:hypothetical protein
MAGAACDMIYLLYTTWRPQVGARRAVLSVANHYLELGFRPNPAPASNAGSERYILVIILVIIVPTPVRMARLHRNALYCVRTCVTFPHLNPALYANPIPARQLSAHLGALAEMFDTVQLAK